MADAGGLPGGAASAFATWSA